MRKLLTTELAYAQNNRLDTMPHLRYFRSAVNSYHGRLLYNRYNHRRRRHCQERLLSAAHFYQWQDLRAHIK